MLQWKKDLMISFTVLIFCAINFIYAGKLNETVIKYELAKPGNYIKLWLIVFSILAVILLVKSLKGKAGSVVESIWHWPAIITVITTIVYLFLMPYLGFIIMTAVFLAFLGLVYTYFMKTKVLTGKTLIREIITWTSFSTVVTLVLYFMFSKVLSVILPTFSIF